MAELLESPAKSRAAAGPFFEFDICHELAALPKNELDALIDRDCVKRLKEGYIFSKAGVFSCAKGFFVVMPKILRHAPRPGAGENGSDAHQLLRSLAYTKGLFEKHVNTSLDATCGQEFLYCAFFLALDELLKTSLRDRVFRSEDQVVHAMRGRWLSHLDLAKTHMPLTFSCDVDECDRNHPILQLALRYCRGMLGFCRSRSILNKVKEWDGILSSFVDCPPDSLLTIREAKRLALSDRRFARWMPWLNALDQVAMRQKGHRGLFASGWGKDFEFDTWRFFEQAVYELLVGTNMGSVRQQVKANKILGGAYWETNAEEEFAEQDARMGSRPDLLIETPQRGPVLVECKYKFLRQRKEEKLQLDTADRNQLLAFLLSRGGDLKFDPTAMVVIYPIDEDELGTKVRRLTFAATTSTATISAEEGGSSIAWGGAGKQEPSDVITLHFIGIRTLKCLQLLSQSDREIKKELKYLYELLEAKPKAPEEGKT